MASVDFNRIASNVAALNSLNSLRLINSKLGLAQTRLATGKRINEAADDPAGLSIATKLNARSEGMKIALGNIGDAKNLLAVAEGGLSKMSDLLIQIRSKAEQAASDTMGSTERAAIKQEIQSLAEQLQNITDETKFNGASLLNGSINKRFQTGVEDGEYTSFTLAQPHDPTSMGVSAENLVAEVSSQVYTGLGITATTLTAAAFTGLSTLDTGSYTFEVLDRATSDLIGKTTQTSANPTNITGMDEETASAGASDELSYSSATTANSGGNYRVVIDKYDVAVGATGGTIDYTVYDNFGTQVFTVNGRTAGLTAGAGATTVSLGNTSAAAMMSGVTLLIGDKQVDIADNTSIEFEYIGKNRVKVELKDASGTAMAIDKDHTSVSTGTGIVGYYQAAGIRDTGRGVNLTLGALIAPVAAGNTASFNYEEQGDFVVNVSSASTASAYMASIDLVIDIVSESMASLGALTARMTAKEDTLATAQVNTEAAYNRIMNADMAAEQVNATKFGILQQTALAMLAQVNTGPQAILSLFRA